MALRLTASNISKSYNRKLVLKDCSFSFNSSDIHVLMGPNGSGKSTFLRICALLEDPDKGEINYLSENDILNKGIGLKRRITILLPKIGAFNTNVFKNVAYGLKIRGVKHKDLEKRVNRVLEFVGMINKKNQNALTLSSGETQRMGIARAMVIEPEILFLDEPTASVDQENTEIIEDIILRMKKGGNPTVIMTTHDISQAQRFTERILFMRDGKIFSS